MKVVLQQNILSLTIVMKQPFWIINPRFLCMSMLLRIGEGSQSFKILKELWTEAHLTILLLLLFIFLLIWVVYQWLMLLT
jgi:hypothetical protein